MAYIIPFKGLRYNQDRFSDLAQVTTPPYDVISPDSQERYYSMNEYNIIRMELGKEQAGDSEENNKYTRAGEFMEKWVHEKVLVFEDKPSLYIYDQQFSLESGEVKTRRGLVCLVKLTDFSERVVLPHEETLSKAKVDRFNLMSATHSNISQIFSLYNDPEKGIVNHLNKFAAAHKPEVDFIDDDGVREKLWVMKDEAVIKKIQGMMAGKQLFIADGHHRYETALNFQRRMKSENPGHTGDELYNYVMMVLVEMDDPGLVVFPTHRMVKNLGNYDSKAFLSRASSEFSVERVEQYGNSSEALAEQIVKALEGRTDHSTVFGYYSLKDSAFYVLTLKDTGAMKKALPQKSAAYHSLDVAVLHTLIMEAQFGIGGENMANQKNLTYTRDALEAVEGVKSGEYQCAFFLNATKVGQIKDVSLENEKMPQKSTYFYPKLLTGLVISKF